MMYLVIILLLQLILMISPVLQANLILQATAFYADHFQCYTVSSYLAVVPFACKSPSGEYDQWCFGIGAMVIAGGGGGGGEGYQWLLWYMKHTFRGILC